MGELLCLGMSEFPYFRFRDDELLTSVLRATMTRDDLPAHVGDPSQWPAAMRDEWGADGGLLSSRRHRERVVAGFRRLRATLDEFRPEAVVIFSEDHYENLREDLMPPLAINAAPVHTVRPFEMLGELLTYDNVWEEPHDVEHDVPGAPDFALDLAQGLAAAGFEIPVSFGPVHFDVLAHTFGGVLTYLDFDRAGFAYPVVPFFVNVAGGDDLARHSDASGIDSELLRRLPRPTPARCFELGAAIAAIVRAGGRRVALVAGSSWSHANLNRVAHFLHPDVAGDRILFDALRTGRLDRWREADLAELVDNGRAEVLNWFPVVGAIAAAGLAPIHLELIETYICNSDKVIGAFG